MIVNDPERRANHQTFTGKERQGFWCKITDTDFWYISGNITRDKWTINTEVQTRKIYFSLHWVVKDFAASSNDYVLFLVMTQANFYKIHIILTPVLWCSVCKHRVKILPKSDEMTSTPCTKLSHFTAVFCVLWSMPTLTPDACEHHLCVLTYLRLFWKVFWSVIGSLNWGISGTWWSPFITGCQLFQVETQIMHLLFDPQLCNNTWVSLCYVKSWFCL